MRWSADWSTRAAHATCWTATTCVMGSTGSLGFTPEDRKENIRRVAETARLMNEAGLIAIAALISPYREGRRRSGSSARTGLSKSCRGRPGDVRAAGSEGALRQVRGAARCPSSPASAPRTKCRMRRQWSSTPSPMGRRPGQRTFRCRAGACAPGATDAGIADGAARHGTRNWLTLVDAVATIAPLCQ